MSMDSLLEFDQLVVGLKVSLSGPVQAVVALKGIRARDVDILIDGARVPGVTALDIAGKVAVFTVRGAVADWPPRQATFSVTVRDEPIVSIRAEIGRASAVDDLYVQVPLVEVNDL